MKILLIDNGTTLLHKLEKLAGPNEVTKKWGSIDSLDASSYDLIILSGSSEYSVMRNHDLFEKEIQLIRSAQVPVMGICFGCELVAYAFGGKLGELKNRRQGIKEIRFLDPKIGSKTAINVYENHQWAITALPDGFSVIAESEDGPEIIRHLTLPIYGIQFHPENLVDETEGDEVFTKIIQSLTSLK